MTNNLIISLEFALAIQFIYMVHQPGMIMHVLVSYCKRLLPEFLHKPFFDCTICMSGVYSVFFLIVVHNYFGIACIWVAMLTGGWNTLFNSITQYLYYYDDNGA